MKELSVFDISTLQFLFSHFGRDLSDEFIISIVDATALCAVPQQNQRTKPPCWRETPADPYS